MHAPPWKLFFSTLPQISQFLLAMSVAVNVISVYVSLRDSYLRWESIFEGTVADQGEVGVQVAGGEGGREGRRERKGVNIAPGLSLGPLGFRGLTGKQVSSRDWTWSSYTCGRILLFYTLIARSLFACDHGSESGHSKVSLCSHRGFTQMAPCPRKKEATVGYICLRPSAAGLVIGRWREGFYDMLSSTLWQQTFVSAGWSVWEVRVEYLNTTVLTKNLNTRDKLNFVDIRE